MAVFQRLTSLLALGVLCVSLAGCQRSISSGTAADSAQAQAALESAFKEAKPEVKDLANQAASAIQSQDAGKAFVQLNGLNASPDLTPEQRAAAAQSMLQVSQQLQSAAQKGDQEAAKLLQMYRSSK